MKDWYLEVLKLRGHIAELEAKLERVQLFCERAVNFYPDLRDDYEAALEDDDGN